MRTPSQRPSASFRRPLAPMPPRSSVRRTFRPWPRPRKRRGAGATYGQTCVGQALALAHREVRVVLRAQRLHVVRGDEAAVRRLVLHLVHRHVLVPVVTVDQLVPMRTDHPRELQGLRAVFLVVPLVERRFLVRRNRRLDDEEHGRHCTVLRSEQVCSILPRPGLFMSGAGSVPPPVLAEVRAVGRGGRPTSAAASARTGGRLPRTTALTSAADVAGTPPAPFMNNPG